MPELACPLPGDYVLLHRDTGIAHYATRATEAEIHRANQALQGAGSASRYVASRHLGPHAPQRSPFIASSSRC